MDKAAAAEQKKMISRFFFGAMSDYVNNNIGWPTIEIAGYTVGIGLPNYINAIRTFPVAKSDVIIASFPKSGTTWMQHIVYLLMTQDFKGGEEIPIDIRIPELEMPAPYPSKVETLEEFAKKPSPRIMKTHLPPAFLPYTASEGKTIYLYRNPKDMVVSLFHHLRTMPPTLYDGPFEDVVEEFMAGKIVFSPWHKHIRDYYEFFQSNKSNVKLIAFEELKRDRIGVIRQVAEFLGVDASEDLIQNVSVATSFEAMKNNNACNYSWMTSALPALKDASFIRKGAVGDWKNHFTPELQARFDAYVSDSMAGCSLKFE